MAAHHRSFVVPLSLLLVVLLVSCAPAPVAAARERIVGGPCEGCDAVFEGLPAAAKLASEARLVPAGEPGEALRLEGVVIGGSGRPASGVIVYAYQADARGIYPRDERFAETSAYRHGRLRGWARTDAAGRYAFATIRPASYPDSDIPQHIHLHVIEPGRCTYWIDDVVFTDDPFLTADVRGRYEHGRGGNGVTTPNRDADGTWRARRDIQLGAGISGYPK